MNHEYESPSLHPYIQNAVARILFFVCYSYHIITSLKFTISLITFKFMLFVSLQCLHIILFYLCICSCIVLLLVLLTLSLSLFSLFHFLFVLDCHLICVCFANAASITMDWGVLFSLSTEYYSLI